MTTSPSADDTDSSGERMSYAELFRRRQELVGDTVDVDGKVFFYSKCPPPDDTASECTLAGYLAAPDRNDLTASDLKDALALSEGGRLVSCPESKAVDGACPGWRHATGYRVVAVVEHQVLGGRQTQQIELEVKRKRIT